MAISRIQATGYSQASATSISKAFTSDVTVDSLVVAVCSVYDPSSAAWAVGNVSKTGTCTLGTWTLDKSSAWQGTQGVAIFSAPVTVAGTCTIAVGGRTSGSYLLLGIAEFSGAVLTAGRVETSNSSVNSSGSPSSGSVTSSAGAVFVAGAGSASTANPTTITDDAAFESIWKQENGSAQQPGSVIDRIVTTGTTDTANWTFSATSFDWAAAIVVYTASAEAPPLTWYDHVGVAPWSSIWRQGRV